MLTKRSASVVDWKKPYHYPHLGNSVSIVQTRAGFEFVQFFIALALLVATISNRRHRRHGVALFKTFIISLLSYLIANLLSATIDCINMTDPPVTMAFELAFFLGKLAWLLAYCTITLLSYRIISNLQERSTGRPPKGLNILHGVFLGFLAIVCATEWSLYVSYSVVKSPDDMLLMSWHWVQCARFLLLWFASMEIVVRALIVTVRTSRNDRQARPSALCFLLSSMGFFAVSFAWAIITIQWDIIAYWRYLDSSLTPKWVRYFQIIFPAFCLMTIYFGLMLCCIRLAGLHDFDAVPPEIPSFHAMTTYQQQSTMPSEMDSQQRMIVESDPSRQFWEAGSRPIHEADSNYNIVRPHEVLTAKARPGGYA